MLNNSCCQRGVGAGSRSNIDTDLTQGPQRRRFIHQGDKNVGRKSEVQSAKSYSQGFAGYLCRGCKFDVELRVALF